MKKALLVLLALAITPAFVAAEEEDSTAEKLIKLKIVQDAGDDSLIKKGAKLNAADNILSDSEDSTVEKAVKLKVMDDVTD